MTDIIEKLNEALSPDRMLRHVKWNDLMMTFFTLLDEIQYYDPKKRKHAQKISDKMIKNLQSFMDLMPTLEKYTKTEIRKS